MPTFLKEKPMPFIRHCLQRMPPKCESIEKDQIEINEESEWLHFLVSSLSGKTYKVEYEHNIPCCSCPDFEKSHWPCKHILSVFEHYPQHGWDSLNALYTSQPCFNVDIDIITYQNMEQSPLVVDTSCLNEKDEKKKTVTELEERTIGDAVSLRKACIEVLKNVQESLYATEDVDVLRNVKEHLDELDLLLNKEVPKLCGLPIRLKMRPKNLKSLRKENSKEDNSKEHVIPIESDIIQESEVDEYRIKSELIPFIEGLLLKILVEFISQ